MRCAADGEVLARQALADENSGRTLNGHAVFDPAGEYGNLVGALGGANVELAPGCSAVFNPLDTADVAVMGVPFDSGVSFRSGARFGPAGIREAMSR